MSPSTAPCPRRGRVIFWYLTILIAAEVAFGAFEPMWQHYSPDDYRLRVDECAREQPGIVFVGGSPVAEGIDPNEIGPLRWQGEEPLRSYSLGFSGGTASDFYFGLRHACPIPPKLLVYGMTASDFNDSRHEPHGVQSIMTADDVRDWRSTRPDAAEWLTRHYAKGKLAGASSLWRNRFGIRMWTANECERLAPGSCPESAAEAERQRTIDDDLHRGTGYAPTRWFATRRYSEMKQAGWVAGPFAYLANYQTGSHAKYLNRMMDWAAEANVEVLLVDMPVTNDLETRYADEFVRYRDLVGSIARSRGVPILHGTEANLDDSHFADLIHLNRDGCVRFSGWLRRELAPRGESGQPILIPHPGATWAEAPR